jgi:hypothetical protein
MFGIGLPELLIIVVACIVLFGGGSLRRNRGVHISGPTLVLRRFEIDESSTSNVFVDIVGRASGISAWLLTIIGFDAETSLKVTDKEVSFKTSSLMGQIHQVVPLSSVSSTHCGFSKPIGYFILGVFFILGGLLSGLGQRGGGVVILIGIILGGIFLIAYYLSKKIVISIETSGGIVLGVSFKRSVIENVGVDINKALKAIMLVNNKTIESKIH